MGSNLPTTESVHMTNIKQFINCFSPTFSALITTWLLQNNFGRRELNSGVHKTSSRMLRLMCENIGKTDPCHVKVNEKCD